jgi:hypothetical protein
MITLEQVKRAFPKGTVKNGQYLTLCPVDRHKNKPRLSVTEENGTVLVKCLAGCAQDRVWNKVVGRVQQGESATTGEPPIEPETGEPWPSWLPQYPNDWQPISQKSRDAIAAKRPDYTPTLETLRAAGVVEAKEKFVAFPCRVGDELRNLRVLDFTKPKKDWDYLQYRTGPEPGTRIAPDKAVMFSPQPLIELIDAFEPVFIVEGQWDAITMHEHGFSCVSLLSSGQPTIAPDVLDYLGRAECIYFAYDNDGGTGLMAAERLAPLLPPDRTFLFPWAEWSVKDACELRSRCESADQFKQEISSLIERIEDTEEDRETHPEHYEYLDKLEKWDGNGPAPEPETPQTPGMGDEAFHGVAGDYIRSLKGNSEASQEGMLVLFLSAFSSMVGYRAWTRVEETVHYPNLFAIVAGKSSRARKDTGYNRIIKPLKEADETWAKECCKSHFASGEALAEYFIKRQSDPRLFFADREFKGTLSICAREGNTLSPKVRSLYDSIAMEDNTKSGGQRVAPKTTGSWVGLITLRELRETLAEVELASGFANRFLFAIARRSKKLPFGGTPVDTSDTAVRISEVLAWLNDKDRHIQFSDTARPIWESFYNELSDADPDYLTRAEANTLRLAMNFAILDRSEEIRPEHLKAALAVWQFCAASATEVFGSQGSPDAEHLAQAVKQSRKMSRTQISEFFGRNKLTRELDDICSVCVEVYGLKLGKDKSLSANS